MLRSDALDGLDNISAEEALRRSVDGSDTPAKRIATLLGGGSQSTEATTVGDILFRWARTEPDALSDADIPSARRISDIIAATGRLPKRLGLGVDFSRAAYAAGAAFQGRLPSAVEEYLLSRLLAHIHDAQFCETLIGFAGDDPKWILINGLTFAVQHPSTEPPGRIERLTLVVEQTLGWAALRTNANIYPVAEITVGVFATLMPAVGMVQDLVSTGWEVAAYANAAAQAAGLVLRRDSAALMQLSNLVGTAAAGHVGHIAGHAAAVALFGLAGSWMIVLAPIASGLAGRVVARNLARRARFAVLCRKEVGALNAAVANHCTAIQEVVDSNLRSTKRQADRFSAMHQTAKGAAKFAVADWLERIEHIQSYRRLVSLQLGRAISNPATLDRRDGDPLAAAQESLLICARSGVHPANVTKTSQELVDASLSLQKKMSVALV